MSQGIHKIHEIKYDAKSETLYIKANLKDAVPSFIGSSDEPISGDCEATIFWPSDMPIPSSQELAEDPFFPADIEWKFIPWKDD